MAIILPIIKAVTGLEFEYLPDHPFEDQVNIVVRIRETAPAPKNYGFSLSECLVLLGRAEDPSGRGAPPIDPYNLPRTGMRILGASGDIDRWEVDEVISVRKQIGSRIST